MDVLTIGVEEEYHLVDRVSRAPVNRAPAVIRALAGELGGQVQAEFYNAQVEICTEPTADREDLREQLVRLRRSVAQGAEGVGCLAVASGTAVIPPQEPLTVTDTDRYHLMAHRFAECVGPDRLVCGCHVHVGSLCRGRALALANHMRPWLPVLQSITGNSPFVCGRDTGLDSGRSVAYACWPTVGPPPLVDEPQYLEYVDGLVSSGVLLDRGMVYWHARPSEHVPTLEIRIADVNADLDTVVLTAALVRGLASALLVEVDADVPPPRPPERALRAAHWLAATHGIDGPGLDVWTGRREPAGVLVDRLLERAAPGLEPAGDLGAVRALWAGLRGKGTGARRQRGVYAATGSLEAVVDSLDAARAGSPVVAVEAA
ncbi:glutamate--cysteine ligase [Streptomyces sp. NBC_00091]|uniref:carboxylate-amine ligase n=1 Tax=Streptomyces sp. NBC_00091 TaxID=2975648 RepID=UPI00225566DE|nr:glutamate--cysteine ligase [Streptomyces sp. NBC_00091]MCX5381547.1 glutamate--cysteine ligase [Streptomyces sp. NBC_00091]